MEQGECQTVTAHADRVPKCNRAAVHVDLVRVDAELGGRCNADSGKCFVELEQVEIGATLFARSFLLSLMGIARIAC